MADYRTPGVYIEEIPKFPPSVAQVETAIPAFIGFTEKAVRDGEDRTLRPTRITSLLEYNEYFGGAQKERTIRVNAEKEMQGDKLIKEIWTADFAGVQSTHLMFYALQIYFDNGGGPCYIVSCGPYFETFGAEIVLGTPTARDIAGEERGLLTGLNALQEEDEPTLIVFPESQGMSEANHYTLLQQALNQCVLLKDRFVIMDLHARELNMTSGQKDNRVLNFRSAVGSVTDDAKYGAAYFPNVLSVFNYRYDEDLVQIVKTTNGDGAATQLYGVVNNAEKSKARAAIDGLSINLPPSPAVAGVYARVDSNRGVWKAPANENVFSISGLTYKLTDEMQERLNVDDNAGKSINCIRFFTGKGNKIWGARTLAGNDNEWRYVPVRRFFNMVEESVKKATYPFVFEPNDANTWVRVRAMIENFLILQWRAGALQGDKPDKAFYVAVGLGVTMTALDILEGRMIVEIGMAVVRPAEFIILRFSHKLAEA
jgi:uncharacterized protein